MSQLEKKWGSTIKVAATTGPAMTVRKLISQLQKYPQDLEVVLFAEGEHFPAITTQDWNEKGDKRHIEISGGWSKLSDKWFIDPTNNP